MNESVFFFNCYRNVRNYHKLYRLLSMMSYFGLREWKFSNNNIDQLATLLKSQQQKQQSQHQHIGPIEFAQRPNGISKSFALGNGAQNGTKTIANHTIHNKFTPTSKPCLEFDMRTIDWDEYFCHYFPGIKKYFLKEPTPDTKKSVKHNFKWVFFFLHFTLWCC